MKNILYLFLFLLIGITSCKSSKNITKEKYEKIFYFHPDKSKSTQRLNINNNFTNIIVEDSLLEYDFWNGIDTIKIVEHKAIKNGIALVIFEEKETAKYKSITIHNTDVKGLVTLYEVQRNFFTAKEAFEALSNDKIRVVVEQPFFSEEYDFENTKPLTELTKEEYIKILEYIVSLKNNLQEFVKANYLEEFDESKVSLLNGRVTDLIEKKMFLMDYDGYAKNKTTVLKSFESDAKVKQLKNQIRSFIE
ncbi:hypothetical protein WAF17_07260 [Bernardetia sp. ABR2-2B]|uniref:hypothetical protein n=1 Tax=Bernardetia sp. ABR2-2B TaxID=3127472 RepID=UPI0030D4DC08